MVVVTDEKDLVRDLAEAPHAEVLRVLEPRGEAPTDSLPPDTTLVVDLRAVLGDSMASFVSSSTLAGLEVRPFSQAYEEHTERIPLVHLAEGWEISVPLGRRAFYAPFKRIIEVALTVITAPLWLLLMAATAIAIRIDSPGPVIFKQQRAGQDDQPFTIYKFRTMVVDADKDGPQFTRQGRPAHHADRPVPALDPPRRGAAAGQRAQGRRRAGRPARRAGGLRRAVPAGHPVLPLPPPGAAGHHRLGPGELRLRGRPRGHHREAHLRPLLRAAHVARGST